MRPFLDPAEWDCWYEGKPAAKDLDGTDGRVAVWNTVMDEHNYLARRWSELTAG